MVCAGSRMGMLAVCPRHLHHRPSSYQAPTGHQGNCGQTQGSLFVCFFHKEFLSGVSCGKALLPLGARERWSVGWEGREHVCLGKEWMGDFSLQLFMLSPAPFTTDVWLLLSGSIVEKHQEKHVRSIASLSLLSPRRSVNSLTICDFLTGK